MSQFKVGDEVLIVAQKQVGVIKRVRTRTLAEYKEILLPDTYVVFIPPHTEEYCFGDQLMHSTEINRLLYL